MASEATAGVPSFMNYQGYLRNATSHAPLTATVRMTFSLYTDSLGLNALWCETQNNVNVDAGVFNVLLGQGSPCPGSPAGLPQSLFTGARLWMQTAVNDTALTPRVPIVSVAYAFKAAKADTAAWSANGGTSPLWSTDGTNVWRSSGNVGIGNPTPGNVLDVRGTGPGDRGVSVLETDGEHIGAELNANADRGFLGLHQGGARKIELNAYPGAPQFFDNGGNVGVGTTAPGVALHVARGDHTVLYVTDSGSDYSDDTFNATIEASGGVHSQLHLKGRGGGGYAAGGLRAYFDGSVPQNPGWIGTSSNHNLGLGVNSATTMLLSTTGGVGLGTLSPSGRLDVDGRTFCRDGVDFGQGTTPGGTDAGMISWGSTPTLKFTILAKEGKALSLGADNREDVMYITSGESKVNGDLCVTGAKNAIVPTSQGMTKVYSEESAEVWFTDYGKARLSNGHRHVDLSPLFLETVTISPKSPMLVFLQEEDECNGLVVKPGETGFEVREKAGGQSSAQFSYRVVAKRKGFEHARLEPASR